MPVFISHRTADNAIAQQVATRLTHTHGIKCYLDDIDQRLKTASQQEVTRILVDMVNKCTNLLAVITANTEGSWWVPFEIGVAKQAPRVICSMTNQADSALPGYLMEWPRLRGDRAIDEFAKLYKLQQKVLTENVLEKRATASTQLSTVDSFHRSLKAALGQ
jgi:hypothetical protein